MMLSSFCDPVVLGGGEAAIANAAPRLVQELGRQEEGWQSNDAGKKGNINDS